MRSTIARVDARGRGASWIVGRRHRDRQPLAVVQEPERDERAGDQEHQRGPLVEERDRERGEQRADGEPGVAAEHEPGQPRGRPVVRDPVGHPRGLRVEGGDAEARRDDAGEDPCVAPRKPGDGHEPGADGHPAPEEQGRRPAVREDAEEGLDRGRDQQRGADDHARGEVRQRVDGREDRQERGQRPRRGVHDHVPGRQLGDAASVDAGRDGRRRARESRRHLPWQGRCPEADRSAVATWWRPWSASAAAGATGRPCGRRCARAGSPPTTSCCGRRPRSGSGLSSGAHAALFSPLFGEFE